MIEEIKVPDLGGAADVTVIDIAVKPGDTVEANQTLITVEGDKASMEVPSPKAGVIKALLLKIGDKVSTGSPLCSLEVQASTDSPKTETPKAEEKNVRAEKVIAPPKPTTTATPAPVIIASGNVHAGPSVRRLAYQLGVDLSRVAGSGNKNRILKEDLFLFVKRQLSQPSTNGLPEAPQIDFTRFGEIEKLPLSKIKKATAKNLHRSWVLIPHVTQFDEADITNLEAFRVKEKAKAESQGFKLTLLAFLLKIAVDSLKAFPSVNASLEANGENLILKKYFHLGVAVDTPNGLVVPVIRNVDQKEVFDIAKELGEISEKARKNQLTPGDMQGACFTISSLGGIGGTAFTPIINMPEVAILGVSRAAMKPIYDGKTFQPRLMLPLSLSYDHRVIDGAEGARFTRHLANNLEKFNGEKS